MLVYPTSFTGLWLYRCLGITTAMFVGLTRWHSYYIHSVLLAEPPSSSWLLDLGRWSTQVSDPTADCPVITLWSLSEGWVVVFAYRCPSLHTEGGRSSSAENANCVSIVSYMGSTRGGVGHISNFWPYRWVFNLQQVCLSCQRVCLLIWLLDHY